VTAVTAAAVGLAIAGVAPLIGAPRWSGALGAAVVMAPPVGVAALAGTALVVVFRRIGGRRREAADAERDVVVLADLVALGLSAGLGLPEALREAARWVSPPLAAELRRVLRAVRSSGAAAALAGESGRAALLYRSVAAAVASGGPLVGVVEGFAAERRHAEHARSMEAARRLPVRLLVPLALLILPGFVVLAVGPALLDSLARLETGP
jgi:tight adherence protein C